MDNEQDRNYPRISDCWLEPNALEIVWRQNNGCRITREERLILDLYDCRQRFKENQVSYGALLEESSIELRDARRRIAELEKDAERVRANAFNEAVDSLRAQCAAWIDADVTDGYDKFTDEAVDELLKIAAQRQKEGK